MNVLKKREYQKARRVYRQNRERMKGWDETSTLPPTKSENRYLKAELNKERAQIAKESFGGNRHAVIMTELRNETQDMEEMMKLVTAERAVKVRGKQTPLRDFAYKQAFGLALCSRKAVYQYNTKTERYKFMHSLRCGRRTCAVCSHFESIEDGKMILAELQDKITGLTREQKKGGRVVLITLTHENVGLERAFDIVKAWRHTQMMKQKVYKTKDNPYHVWNQLQWGMWRWEITRNEETGLYHPHIHIMAYTQAWLRKQKGGYFYQMVNSWRDACALQGHNVDWLGQDVRSILYFKEKPHRHEDRALAYDCTRSEIEEVVEGAVAEMAKYAIKSTDFTKIKRGADGADRAQIANEMALLFALMAGRRVKNGFGGFALRSSEETEEPVEEKGEPEEEANPEDLREAVYAWDRRQRRYVLQIMRKWDEKRFKDYVTDMGSYKDRHTLVMYYGLERTPAA